MTNKIQCFLFAILLLVQLVNCAPKDLVDPASTYRSKEDGSFRYGSKLDENNFQVVEGLRKDVQGNEVIVLKGSYKHSLPDGSILEVTYTADENGYHSKTVQSSPQDTGPILIPLINAKAVASILG